MAINLLSAAQCKSATSEGRSVRKLSDGGGLYLWVHADGSKYWRFHYWLANTEKSLSLGVFPTISLKEARAKCDDQRKLLTRNLDPSSERKAGKLKTHIAAENSFETAANEWYAKQKHTWVAHHAADVLRRLESNTYPSIGKRAIAEIEVPELLAALRKIEERGTYDLAHRVLQVCGQVFRYGIAIGRCKHDLSADLRGALAPHKKQHQAAVRTNELIGAHWTEFDLDKALWVIPAVRMKMKTEHVVPLSPQTYPSLPNSRTSLAAASSSFPAGTRKSPSATIPCCSRFTA